MKAIIFLAATLITAPPRTVQPLALPGADGFVGFDDLRFSPGLRKVLVPAGRTGRVDLVDRGRAQSRRWPASARLAEALVVGDPVTERILMRASLSGSPDYVRWVEPREVWVTEPGRKVIETFRLEATSPPTLTRTGTIEVPDGPEGHRCGPRPCVHELLA